MCIKLVSIINILQITFENSSEHKYDIFSKMSICQQDAQGVQSVLAQSWVVSFADVILVVNEVILIQVVLMPVYLVERITMSSPPSELAPYTFAPYFLSSPCNGITPDSSQITHLDIYLKHTCELAWVIGGNLCSESEEHFNKKTPSTYLKSNLQFQYKKPALILNKKGKSKSKVMYHTSQACVFCLTCQDFIFYS